MKALREAAGVIGYPLVMKGSSPSLAHKTEEGMVRVDVRNAREARAAFQEMMCAIKDQGGSILVQEMIKGTRELMVGMTRDPQFGPCVMFGLGGIYTEILKDVSFRVAPLSRTDAMAMLREIRASKILDEVRGMPSADMERLCHILVRVGEIGLQNDSIREIDINPLIIRGRRPVAADAMVVLNPAT